MAPREGLPGLDSSLPFSAERLDHLFLVFHGAGDPYVHHQPWLSSLEKCLTRLQSNYDVVLNDMRKLTRPNILLSSSSSSSSSSSKKPIPTSNKAATTSIQTATSTSTSNSISTPTTPTTTSTSATEFPTALFLPIEWHRSAFETWQSEVRIADPRPMNNNNNTNTTTTINTVREAVSDSLGDIIMMSSPFWRRTLATHVSKQIASQFAAVRRNRPAFSGRVSILAHSIGSIIALELIHRQLLPDDVEIDAVFMTGCPIPAYAVLAPDEQPALATIRKYRSSIRFINVFHPLDPVAYRLEPFVFGIENEHETLAPAVKVAPKRRTFWQDAELFWDDVVYNLWSSLFPQQHQQYQEGIRYNKTSNNKKQSSGMNDDKQHDNDIDTEQGEKDGNNRITMANSTKEDNNENEIGNTRSKSHVRDVAEQNRRKRALRRSSSYVLSADEAGGSGNGGDIDDDGGEVLLSGRIDYELQDGMGMPPLDVMASWGAIKAHTYYWQSLDVAQMLLDVAMTSEIALSSRLRKDRDGEEKNMSHESEQVGS